MAALLFDPLIFKENLCRHAACNMDCYIMDMDACICTFRSIQTTDIIESSKLTKYYAALFYAV